MIVAMVFLGYTFLGPYAPGFLAWKGASFNAVAYHQWLSTEGVFGIALKVMFTYVFLFVIFGALLQRSAATQFIIDFARRQPFVPDRPPPRFAVGVGNLVC